MSLPIWLGADDQEMFACGLFLGVTSSTDFRIMLFISINNLCCHGLDFSRVVIRSGLDNSNIYICITCY